MWELYVVFSGGRDIYNSENQFESAVLNALVKWIKAMKNRSAMITGFLQKLLLVNYLTTVERTAPNPH